MPDKDQFTFDDDDGFPETNLGDRNNSQLSDPNDDFPESDLSAAFSDGEHEVEQPSQEEPEPKVKSGGSSGMRILLMVVLLVVAGGAGVYYFMDLGGTTPAVPTVAVPAQKATKSVALPPQPAKAPAAPAKAPATPAKAEPVTKTVTVAVPPPPPPAEPVAKADNKGTPVKQSPVAVKPQPAPAPQPVEKASADKAVAEKPKSVPAKQPTAQVSVPAPKPVAAPQTKVVAVKPTPKPVPAPQKAVTLVPAKPKPAVSPSQVLVSPNQVTGGAYALDAGSYLLESNRKSLAAKIKKLGYEPIVTPVDATLDMTRLRLGTFGKDEVQEALDFARTIESGSYSAPAGDRYVIYAGTFLKSRNVEKLTKLFLAEGIKVYPEPVQVVRTLSRIRFGSFATKEDAAAAAREVGEAGLKAVVVKSK